MEPIVPGPGPMQCVQAIRRVMIYIRDAHNATFYISSREFPSCST